MSPHHSVALPLLRNAAFLAVMLAASRPQLASAAGPPPVLRTVLRLASVVAGAKAAEEAGVSLQDYWRDTVAPGQSVYSVSLSFDRSSGADFWSGPDVFLVVECEGASRVVVPEIQPNWDYSAKVFNFRCPTLSPGSTCRLQLCDDDGQTDQLLKSLLTQQVKWEFRGGATSGGLLPASGVMALEATVAANGTLQLLSDDAAHKMVLDAPDLIASASFQVPDEHSSAKWELTGTFISDGTDMGEVRLTHWYSNPVPQITAYLLRPTAVFWCALFLGLLVVLASTWRYAAAYVPPSSELPEK